MDGQGQDQGHAKPIAPSASGRVQGSGRKDLLELRADVSICRKSMEQLRDMLHDLQRKQTEAIADMFKTVVFGLNGTKRVDSPSKNP